jgi:hypothetical protein
MGNARRCVRAPVSATFCPSMSYDSIRVVASLPFDPPKIKIRPFYANRDVAARNPSATITRSHRESSSANTSIDYTTYSVPANPPTANTRSLYTHAAKFVRSYAKLGSLTSSVSQSLSILSWELWPPMK